MKQLKKVYSKWDELPHGKVQGDTQPGCLVIEGGGFRGLYNEGVLDALLVCGIHFHTVIGVSAGTLGGMSYVTGQLGRAGRINLAHRFDPEFVGLKGFLKSKSVLNLDYVIYPNDKIEPFYVEEMNALDRRFVAVVTNCETGETEYLEKTNCSDMYLAIKASASMSFSTRIVHLDGKKLLDGGCSTHLPYDWAINEGYEKIVVIRTRDKTFRRPGKVSKMPEIYYHKFPRFAKVLKNKELIYNDQCDKLDEYEKDGRIFVLAPSRVVDVELLESDIEKLGNLYWLGYNDTMANIDKLREYLK